jgi:DNA polymerase III delta subunit
MKNNKKYTNKMAVKSNYMSLPYTVYQQKIRAGQVETVYILFGTNHPGKIEFIAELKSADNFKVEEFTIPEMTSLANELVNNFSSKVFTPSLWGERMLLVLKNFHNIPFTKQKEILQRLSTLPKNYFATTVIESKYNKGIQDMLADYNFAVMNFFEPDERVLNQYVYDMAKTIGLVIDPESSRLLIDMIGNDFSAINQELEKIKTMLGEKKRITTEIVLNACGFSKETSIDDLVGAVFNRNINKSLVYLFCLQNDRIMPVIIISSLANIGFRLLQLTLGAAQKSVGFEKTGQRKFQILERQSRLWTKIELTNFLLELAKIDKKIKTGYPEPYVLIENLIIKSIKKFEYDRNYAGETRRN